MQSKGVLAVSLCLNLGLVGVLGYYAKNQPPGGAPAEGRAPSAAGTTEGSTVPGATSSGTELIPAASNAPAPPKFTWREVEAADYKEYIAKLRGVACPEETIKDIIIADVNKLYAPRYAALRDPEPEFKFWKRNNYYGSPPPDKEKQKLVKQLTEEKEALLKELLGIDLKKEQGQMSWYQEQQEQLLGFLSPEKRDQLRKPQQKYDEERSEIYRLAGGFIDQETQADLRKIYKKQLADLAQFLTPQEIEEYALRTSDTARNLKYQLTSLSPTEQEFREIYRVKSLMEDYQNPTEEQRADKEFMKKRSEALKEGDQALKEKLGEERYTEYTRAQDYTYTSLTTIADVFGIEKAAVNKVYDAKKEAESQATKIRNDRNLTPEQRTEALRAVRATTTREITALMGEKGYKAYRRQGGYWLSNISPN